MEDNNTISEHQTVSTDIELNDDSIVQTYRNMGLPISCEAYLQGHSKPVTCISIE